MEDTKVLAQRRKALYKLFDNMGIIYYPSKANEKAPIIKGYNKIDKSVVPLIDQNICFMVRKEANLFVLDIDNKLDESHNGTINGLDMWNKVLQEYNQGNEIDTVIVETASGGRHYYFKYNEELESSGKAMKVQCVKYKNSKVQWDLIMNSNLVAPFSYITKNGTKNFYKFVKDHSLTSSKINNIPYWLAKIILSGNIDKDIDIKPLGYKEEEKSNNIEIVIEPVKIINSDTEVESEVESEINISYSSMLLDDGPEPVKQNNIELNNISYSNMLLDNETKPVIAQPKRKSIENMSATEYIKHNKKQSLKKENTVIGLAKLRKILYAIDPKKVEKPRNVWFKILYACYNSVAPEELNDAKLMFIEYCKSMSNFNEREIMLNWDTCKNQEYVTTYNRLLKYIIILNYGTNSYQNSNREFNKLYCNLLPKAHDKLFYMQRFIVYFNKYKKFGLLKYYSNSSKDYEEVIDCDMHTNEEMSTKLSNLDSVYYPGNNNKIKSMAAYKYFKEHCKYRKEFDAITFNSLQHKLKANNNLLIRVMFDYTQTETDKLKIGTKCDLIVNHIKEIICSNNNETYEYVMHWLARLIQKPQEKIDVALYCLSLSGTGKSLIFDKLLCQQIIGERYSSIINNAADISNFQSLLSNKSFVLFEEIERVNNSKSIESKIKQYISGSIIPINEKFKTEDNKYSFNNFVFLSNKTESALVMDDDDRRFFVFNVSDAKKGDMDYFKRLDDAILNNEIVQDFVNLLYTYDVESFNLRKYPTNEFSKEMKCQSSVERFIKDISDKIVDGYDIISTGKKLYEKYKEYCESTHEKIENYSTFHNILIKCKTIKTKRTNKNNVIIISGRRVIDINNDKLCKIIRNNVPNEIDMLLTNIKINDTDNDILIVYEINNPDDISVKLIIDAVMKDAQCIFTINQSKKKKTITK